jgi:hypothetical protein
LGGQKRALVLPARERGAQQQIGADDGDEVASSASATFRSVMSWWEPAMR